MAKIGRNIFASQYPNDPAARIHPKRLHYILLLFSLLFPGKLNQTNAKSHVYEGLGRASSATHQPVVQFDKKGIWYDSHVSMVRKSSHLQFFPISFFSPFLCAIFFHICFFSSSECNVFACLKISHI